MGGRVWAENNGNDSGTENKGCSFNLLIPLCPAPKSVVASAVADCRGSTRGHESEVHGDVETEEGNEIKKEITFGQEQRRRRPTNGHIGLRQKYPLRILAVEDNCINRKVLWHILKRMGYSDLTCFAENGREALDAYRPGAFDLILMDIQMPVMDGLQAMTALVKRHGDNLPAVVALTANLLKCETDKYRAAGMFEVLGKPIEVDRLATILQKVHHKSRAKRQQITGSKKAD